MREIKRRKIKKIPMADKEAIEKYTGLSQATLRNWRSRGEHSELFVKIGGKVFLYANAWDRFERKAVRDSRKK
jgi:hypothetical protein